MSHHVEGFIRSAFEKMRQQPVDLPPPRPLSPVPPVSVPPPPTPGEPKLPNYNVRNEAVFLRHAKRLCAIAVDVTPMPKRSRLVEASFWIGDLDKHPPETAEQLIGAALAALDKE